MTTTDLPIETEMYAVLDRLDITLGSAECVGLARWLKCREAAVVARACVELAALRVETQRQQEIIQHQAEQIRSLTEASKGKGKK